jgi:hypothetical protein
LDIADALDGDDLLVETSGGLARGFEVIVAGGVDVDADRLAEFREVGLGGGGEGGRRQVGLGAAEEGRVFARHGDGGLELSKRRREDREEWRSYEEVKLRQEALLISLPADPSFLPT